MRPVLLVVLGSLASVGASTIASVPPSVRPAPSLRRASLLRGGATAPEVAAPVLQSAPASATVVRGGERNSGSLPREVMLLIGAAGIFISFSVFAVLQEDVYKKAYGGEYFASTFFALILERGINALVAAVGVGALGRSGLVIPHRMIFNSGIAQMFAMAASNEALRYVSYPTQVLGKSCKMVPVMAGGIVIGRKTYSLLEYIQVAVITAGVCVFNLGGKAKKGGKPDSPYGLGLIFASLLMDAFTGGLQDKARARPHPPRPPPPAPPSRSPRPAPPPNPRAQVKLRTKQLNPLVGGPKRPSMHESMLWTNLSGCLVAVLLGLLTGHLSGGIAFCKEHSEVLRAILVYSLASAVGQNFVYFTLTQFDPLVLTTVTTTRKIFSTVYSVFRNPSNRLLPMQWAGASMVFTGLLGDIARKLVAKNAKADAKAKQAAAAATAEGAPAAS